MSGTKTKGLPLNGVVFVCSAVFLCTLPRPAIGARLSEPLPMSHIEEEFGKDPAEEVEEAEVDTGRLGEPLAGTHVFDHTDQATAEKHVKDTTSGFKTSSPTESPPLPSTNVGLKPPAETPAPFPETATSVSSASPEKAPHVRNEFPKDLFSLEQRRRGWVILHIIGLIYSFMSLAIVCNEFFVPAVAVITVKLAISEDVAGATVMAAGRSVPKFLAFLIGILLAHSRVGIGAIVGSAVYNVVFVTGMCALLARTILHLNWWPLFRDVSFYIFHLVLLMMFFFDNVMMWWESLMLLGCYAAYVAFMKFDEQVERALKTRLYRYQSIVKVITVDQQDKVDVPAGAHKSGGSEGSNTDEDDGEENREGSRKNEGEVREEGERKEKPLSLKWPDARYERAAYLLLLPIVFPLWLTLPDVRKQKSRKFFVITFLLSILWIIVILYFTLWFGHQVGETFGIPHQLTTVLVGGVINPDLITSVIVARKGLGDMAVSSSVGSNIFDITVGLPVSWLLFSSVHGSASVSVSGGGLVCAGALLFLMLLLVVILIPSSKWKMNKVLGSTMVLLYIIFLVISMMFQYHIIACPVSVGDGP